MLDPVEAQVRAALGDVVYGVNVGGLPEVCLALLKERHLTFATAESCTGGRVAERITALPGASAVYRGGVVSYWTAVKAAVLGCPSPCWTSTAPYRRSAPGLWQRAPGASPEQTLPCPSPAWRPGPR